MSCQQGQNQGWIYRERVPPTAAGQSVLNYYSDRYGHSSRAEWHARILAGQILLEGQVINPDTPLKRGQHLAYHRLPWSEPEVPLDFEVLYEDSDVLAVSKPAGLPVLPGGGFLQHTLLHHLKQHYPKDTPVPIHRLGRGTSGVLLLARSPLAKAHLSQQMRQSSVAPSISERTLQKTYRALVGPSIGAQDLGDRFTLATPIGKLPHPLLGYVYGSTPAGLPAYSEGQVLTRSPQQTLLEVTIRTGRPHQIRIHLAAAGYPLIGDPLYTVGGIPRLTPPAGGTKLPVPGDIGYYLHACHLRFLHPRLEKSIAIACEPPPILR